MNNLQLAERCLLQAADMCPQDPAVAHELGVLAYRCAAMGHTVSGGQAGRTDRFVLILLGIALNACGRGPCTVRLDVSS